MAVELPNNWWQRLRKQAAFWVVSGISLFFLAGFVLLLWAASVAGSVTGGGGYVNTEAFMWVAGVIAAIAAVMFFYGFYLHFTRQK
jgi:hypothetical protein